mmetsp:Transcript_64919/g.146451  ORF Transcript_64919/g.146451 Transcript_64919/m.146451 type:complete len:620 (+) Transcript_64919:1014-2873(+)
MPRGLLLPRGRRAAEEGRVRRAGRLLPPGLSRARGGVRGFLLGGRGDGAHHGAAGRVRAGPLLRRRGAPRVPRGDLQLGVWPRGGPGQPRPRRRGGGTRLLVPRVLRARALVCPRRDQPRPEPVPRRHLRRAGGPGKRLVLGAVRAGPLLPAGLQGRKRGAVPGGALREPDGLDELGLLGQLRPARLEPAARPRRAGGPPRLSPRVGRRHPRPPRLVRRLRRRAPAPSVRLGGVGLRGGGRTRQPLSRARARARPPAALGRRREQLARLQRRGGPQRVCGVGWGGGGRLLLPPLGVPRRLLVPQRFRDGQRARVRGGGGVLPLGQRRARKSPPGLLLHGRIGAHDAHGGAGMRGGELLRAGRPPQVPRGRVRQLAGPDLQGVRRTVRARPLLPRGLHLRVPDALPGGPLWCSGGRRGLGGGDQQRPGGAKLRPFQFGPPLALTREARAAQPGPEVPKMHRPVCARLLLSRGLDESFRARVRLRQSLLPRRLGPPRASPKGLLLYRRRQRHGARGPTPVRRGLLLRPRDQVRLPRGGLRLLEGAELGHVLGPLRARPLVPRRVREPARAALSRRPLRGDPRARLLQVFGRLSAGVRVPRGLHRPVRTPRRERRQLAAASG